MINKIFVNIVSVLFNSIFVALLGFILIPIILHSITIEHYGLIVLIIFLSVKNGILGILDFGFQSTLIKFISEYNIQNNYLKKNMLLNILFTFYFVFSVVFISLLYFYAENILNLFFNINETDRYNFYNVFRIYIFSYVFQFFNIVFFAYFEGLQKFNISKSIESFVYLIYFIATIIILKIGYGYIEIIYLLSSMHILTFLLNLYWFSRLSYKFKLSFKYNKNELKKILLFTKKMFFAKIAGTLINHYPKLFITIFLNQNILAIYDIISKIPNMTKVIIGIGNTVVIAVSSELTQKNDIDKNSKLFTIGLKINFLFTIPLLVVLIILSNNILYNWVGDSYTKYSFLMQLLLIIPFLSILRNYGASLLAGANHKVGLFSLITWLNLILNLIYTFLFIKIYQMEAIVEGRLFGLLLVIPIVLSIFIKYFNVNRKFFIVDIIIISIIFMSSFYLSNYYININNIYILAINAFLIYSLYLIFIYIILLDKSEKKYLIKIFNKIKGKKL